MCLVASSNFYCFLPYKESTKTINNVLVEKSKEQWRRSNTSLAMRIAEITESFGKELAGKWSNETSTVRSSEDNIGEQHSFLLTFLIQASYWVIARILLSLAILCYNKLITTMLCNGSAGDCTRFVKFESQPTGNSSVHI